MRNLIPLLFLVPACDGGTEPSDHADTDTDTDADTDTDTDTTPEHCPTEGNAVVAVNVNTASPDFTASDELSIVMFTIYPGPPAFYYTIDGDELGTLPFTAYANNVPPNTYVVQTDCQDIDADNVNNCEGTGDNLVMSSDELVVEAGRVYTWDVDFAAGTYTAAVSSAPAGDCP